MTHITDELIDRTGTLDALDQAERTTPFCHRCGAPMLPVAKGRSLWLECATTQGERPLIRRILDADHTRRIVVDEAA